MVFILFQEKVFFLWNFLFYSIYKDMDRRNIMGEEKNDFVVKILK